MGIELPDKKQLEAFAGEARKALSNLSFELRRAIVLSIIEKIVGTKERLQVYGNIPLSLNLNVEQKLIHRNGLNATEYSLSNSQNDNIPFTLKIDFEVDL